MSLVRFPGASVRHLFLIGLFALAGLPRAALAQQPPSAASDAGAAGVDAGEAAAAEPPDAGEAPPPEAASPAPWEADGGEQVPDEAGLEGLLAQPVVSAASRTAESSSDAPGTTFTISGTDLKRYGIQSVEEAIRFLGHGMASYEYDDRQNAAFGARGFMSDNLGLHIAVLIDGNQAGGSAKTARGTQQYMMPIELVDHIEVVLGPGSVVYGNSAMLGVINVVTRAATTLDPVTATLQASAGLPGDEWARDLSWGEAWGRAAVYGGTRFDLGGDPFELAWHLSARADRQQGRSIWRQADGTDAYADPLKNYSREDAFNRDAKVRLFGRATWGKWIFMGSFALAAASGTGPIESSAEGRIVEPEYMLDATYLTHVGERGDLSLRFYGVVFDSRGLLPLSKPDPAHCLEKIGVPDCADTLHYVNFRPFIEPILAWDWNKDGTQVTTLGAQLFIDGSVITSGTQTPDGSKSQSDEAIVAPLPNAALYGQHIWRGKHGVLNVGLRFDAGILGWALSPRIAYSTQPWKDGTLKAVFSTGFRTPSITERYLEIDGFLTSNEKIKPEHVYSGEIDLAQRLGIQNLQAAVFLTAWEGIITTHKVTVSGQLLSQFANLREVWSAGVNLGWQGSSGPVDWGLSVNYAPGRVRLPADIASQTDEELTNQRLERAAIDRYGSHALGSVLMPADGMPDFYATGHLSYLFGADLPRVSVAAFLSSPRPYVNYAADVLLLDPRNVDGPYLPWSIDLRAALEQPLSQGLLLRFVVNYRTLTNAASLPRVGDDTAPAPGGGVGAAPNPLSPLSAMLELSLRL